MLEVYWALTALAGIGSWAGVFIADTHVGLLDSELEVFTYSVIGAVLFPVSIPWALCTAYCMFRHG